VAPLWKPVPRMVMAEPKLDPDAGVTDVNDKADDGV
jgi:hypothetical protein